MRIHNQPDLTFQVSHFARHVLETPLDLLLCGCADCLQFGSLMPVDLGYGLVHQCFVLRCLFLESLFEVSFDARDLIVLACDFDFLGTQTMLQPCQLTCFN